MRFSARLVCFTFLALLAGARTADSQVIPAFLEMWGDFGSGPGQLNYPYGIEVGTDGNVYVDDTLNYRVVKYSPHGEVLTTWGSYGFGPGQFSGAGGLCFDSGGRLYVADGWRVQVFDPAGGFLLQWSCDNGARDITIAPDGTAHVVGPGSRVSVYSTTGAPIRHYAQDAFISATSIVIDPTGIAYVADEGTTVNTQNISRWSPEGIFLGRFGPGGSGPGQLGGPTGLAFDPEGNLLVAEHNNHRVQVLTPLGGYLGQWGTFGTGPGQFSQPVDVAVDPAGFVYVVDYHRIEKFGYLAVPTLRTSWGGIKSKYR